MSKRFLTFLLLLPSALWAQGAEDTVRYNLPPVTSTATRTFQNLVKVPFSVSIIERSDLGRISGRGFDDVLSGIPGVVAQSRYGGMDVRLTIRGYGARGMGERSNAGTSRGVRILSNGIPETEPDGRTAFDLVDLSAAGRIEVVRSNASSMWGNASGGVINVLSNTDFDRPYLGLQSMFGSFGFKKQAVRAGVQLDGGRCYFSLADMQSDGWRAHSQSSQTLLTTGFVTTMSERTEFGVHLSGATTIFEIPGPLTQAQFDADPRQAQNNPANYSPTYVQRDERRFNRQGRIGMTLSHTLDDGFSLSAMGYINPKYLQRSERNTFRDFTRYHMGGNAILRHSSRSALGVGSEFALGVDEAYQDGAILFYNLTNGERGTTLRDNKREGANNTGVFFQEELTLNEHVSLLVGGRYDAVKYYYLNFVTPAIDKDKAFKHCTPKAGITYRFTPTQSIYASVGGGIEVPAGNETDPPATFGEDTLTAINPLLEPSTSTTFEAGTKHLLTLDESGTFRTVSVEAAVYWISVANDIIPYRGGRFYFTAGKTRRMGAEISVKTELARGFSFQSALAFSNNEYQDYVVDSVHYGVPGAKKDFGGNDVAGVPALVYQAKLRYAPALAMSPFLEAALHGLGSFKADDANLFQVPAYGVVDFSFGMRDIQMSGDRLSLRAWVTVANLFDKKYVSSAFINPDLNGAREPIYLEPGLPRNVVGSVGLNWMF